MSEPVIITPEMRNALYKMLEDYSRFLDEAIESGDYVRFSTKDLEDHKERITRKHMKPATIEKDS